MVSGATRTSRRLSSGDNPSVNVAPHEDEPLIMRVTPFDNVCYYLFVFYFFSLVIVFQDY